jgi:uncharacterized protein YjiS (DUF1127 family)
MEGSSSIQVRMQGHAGYALVDIVMELAASAGRTLVQVAKKLVEAQRQAQARRELHQLSDRFLKDIGVERTDIDGMFR